MKKLLLTTALAGALVSVHAAFAQTTITGESKLELIKA